jgi:anti-sigma factor RsiW
MDGRIGSEDLTRLNAFVDGELEPPERAAMAAKLASDRDLARTHATLARLKACVSASADAQAVPALPLPNRRRFLPAFAMAAALVIVAGLGSLGTLVLWPQDQDSVSESAHTVVKLAALPSRPVVPDLGVAGLKLVGIATESPGGIPTVVATYRGPRGCRLELRIFPADAAISPTPSATGRLRWSVDGLGYELAAFGMPDARFAAVAAAAQNATQNDGTARDGRKLREASLRSPPCLG